MRRLFPLLLVAGFAAGDHLDEVSQTRYVGVPVAITAMAAGDAYIPAVLTQRSDPRGFWRSVLLDFNTKDQAKLKGDAVAQARLGGGVVIATRRSDELDLFELRYEGRRTRNIDHGSIPLKDLGSPTVLSMGSAGDVPVVVVAHVGGLYVASSRPRGRGHADLIARPGRSFTAATAPFQADRDSPVEIFAAGPDGLLQELQQEGAGFRALDEERWDAQGFVPRAMDGDGRQLLLAGQRGDRAVLVGFAEDRRVRFGRVRVRVPRTPSQIDLGKGSIDHVRILEGSLVAVAGAIDGRSWVGVVDCGPRPRVVHEAHLPGTGVLALGTNPARFGWSLAAGTRENSYHLLRLPGDKAAPRDWDPFPSDDPRPPVDRDPEPPVERVPDRPVPVEDDLPPPGGPEFDASLAVLPRVGVDARRGLDTEVVLVYLGLRPAEVTVRLVADNGQTVHFTRIALRRGQRVRFAVAEELRRRRMLDFDGYARIEGVPQRDLVVEALLLRSGERPEVVLPHWR